MNVTELKKAIYAYLKTKTNNVYEVQAPAKAVFPYVVYSLQNSNTHINEQREDFDLYIDVYDNGQLDSTTIDTIIGSIDGDGAIVSASGLHRKHYYVASTLQADFYRTSKNDLSDEENVRHVQLIYDVMSYLE